MLYCRLARIVLYCRLASIMRYYRLASILLYCRLARIVLYCRLARIVLYCRRARIVLDCPEIPSSLQQWPLAQPPYPPSCPCCHRASSIVASSERLWKLAIMPNVQHCLKCSKYQEYFERRAWEGVPQHNAQHTTPPHHTKQEHSNTTTNKRHHTTPHKNTLLES